MKSYKISWPWGVGPRNYIWATWAKKTYPVINPEPLLQFSQTGPQFIKNFQFFVILQSTLIFPTYALIQ